MEKSGGGLIRHMTSLIHDVHVSVIDQRYGHIFLRCEVADRHVVFNCSAFRPPFSLLFYVLQYVWCGAEMAVFELDEETYAKRLIFRKEHGDVYRFTVRGEAMEFNYWDDEEPSEHPWNASLYDVEANPQFDSEIYRDPYLDASSAEDLDPLFPLIYINACVDRKQLIDAFFTELQRFFQNDFDRTIHKALYRHGWQLDYNWLNFGSLKELFSELESFDPERSMY